MKTTPISPFMKAVFLLSLIVMGASMTSPAGALRSLSVDNSVPQLIVSNDDISASLRITTLPFRRTVTSFEATEAVDDPVSTKCGLNPGLATVWYKYRPSANALVHMDTIGSNYDTYMAVWTGTRGSLTEVACNDDASTTEFASAINITLKAGTLYYIEVAQFNGASADSIERVAAKPIPETAATVDTTHVFRLVPVVTRTYKSNGTHDGFVLESTETSNVGLFKDSTIPTIRIGDDSKKRQYVSILSFDTSALPNSAVVTYAKMKLKLESFVGPVNIFTTFGKVRVDIRKPYFGKGVGLETLDFQAAASRGLVGAFGTAPVSGWYIAQLNKTSFPFFNVTGYTQFRLRFAKDDDNDFAADHVRFYSGNSGDTNKPVLILRYYVP